MVNIIGHAKKMIECGELRIVFENAGVNFTGATLSNNGQTVIVLNSKLSYEYNIKKVLHEIMHLQHFNANLDTKECEKQACDFERDPAAFENLINIAE